MDYETIEAIALGANRETRNLTVNVAWISGLIFQVSDGDIMVDGKVYSVTGGLVTLATADGSNDRFDVIVAQTDGTATKVTGTAAADPAVPEVDPDTQVALTTVLVEASATTPTGPTNENVYLENTEWTSSENDSGTNINLADTTDPNNGSAHISFATAPDGDYIELEDGSDHFASEFEALIFAIQYTVANTNSQDRLRIALFKDTDRVSSWVDLRHQTYSLDAGSTGAYQNIIIPMPDFNVGSTAFDTVRFEVSTNGSRTLSLYLDDIKFQTGVPTIDSSNFAKLDETNSFSKAQGSGITTLTDGATISWDASVGNVFKVTLGGNRTMAAPTGATPGHTYILHVIQGAGGQTITWNAVFKWAEATAPTLSTGSADRDILSFVVDESGNFHGVAGILNSS